MLLFAAVFLLSGCSKDDPTGPSDSGTIVIDPSPDSINAPWTLSGPAGYNENGNGDTTLINLTLGNYTVTWEEVTAWITPSSETQALEVDATVTFSGIYIEGTTTPAHDKKYGLYSLDLSTGAVVLIYSSNNSLHRIHENPDGTKLVFQENFGDDIFIDSEICFINPDGSGYQKITDNTWLDAYPSWSPDGTRILFLSWPDYPDNTMDIFVIDADGTNPSELYDSGYHDADCHWVGSQIVFTRESQIWIMDDNGANAKQVTDYELAGHWGNAGLPFGDYDPRLNPSGTLISFDRMVDDQSTSGDYDFYTINTDGTGETAITDTGWQQFIAEWSHAGDRLLFTVASMGGDGLFDMYTMNPDGSDLTNITPADWPAEFLCTHGVYSQDDTKIYFTGEWWE